MRPYLASIHSTAFLFWVIRGHLVGLREDFAGEDGPQLSSLVFRLFQVHGNPSPEQVQLVAVEGGRLGEVVDRAAHVLEVFW